MDELRAAFQQLCGDYDDMLDEIAGVTQPVDERVGLALFKIDEAAALADVVRTDAAEGHGELMQCLLANCDELESIFLRLDIMHQYVDRVQDTAKELEKRTVAATRAANAVFREESPMPNVTSMFRSFSTKKGGEDDGKLHWEPMEMDIDADKVMERLDNADPRQLDVPKAEDSGEEVDVQEQASS